MTKGKTISHEFIGFAAGKTHLTPVPEAFFIELMPTIDTLVELRFTLYAFWLLDRMEGNIRFLKISDLRRDEALMRLIQPEESPDAALDRVIEQVSNRGTFILEKDYLFPNTERGRWMADAYRAGRWQAPGNLPYPGSSSKQRPSIYHLYEQNIGPLTPIIADALKDAEVTYPAAWIEEAVGIAVKNNIRRWRYIEAILRSWQEEGRYEQDRRDNQEDGSRYLKGKFARFIQH